MIRYIFTIDGEVYPLEDIKDIAGIVIIKLSTEKKNHGGIYPEYKDVVYVTCAKKKTWCCWDRADFTDEEIIIEFCREHLHRHIPSAHLYRIKEVLY